jgi:hypothetical protein
VQAHAITDRVALVYSGGKAHAMPSPFPGMDPYLEDPATWTGVRGAILGAIFERLGPAVRPKCAVRFEERVFVTDDDDPGHRPIIPDVRVLERDPSESLRSFASAAVAEPIRVTLPDDDEVHERSLHVIDVRDRSIVTVIELLSPTNKTAGSAGRASFLRKRREVLAGDANWMEIDLLRTGLRTPRPANVPDTEYRVYLSRGTLPRDAIVWPIRLTDRLPVVGVPLRDGDPEVPLDLQAAVDAAVERGSFDLDADYSADAVPPLAGAAAEWARTLTSPVASREPH